MKSEDEAIMPPAQSCDDEPSMPTDLAVWKAKAAAKATRDERIKGLQRLALKDPNAPITTFDQARMIHDASAALVLSGLRISTLLANRAGPAELWTYDRYLVLAEGFWRLVNLVARESGAPSGDSVGACADGGIDGGFDDVPLVIRRDDASKIWRTMEGLVALIAAPRQEIGLHPEVGICWRGLPVGIADLRLPPGETASRDAREAGGRWIIGTWDGGLTPG